MSGGLRVRGLAIRHDGQPVLHDVSLAVREGESLCLLGASGSGKSLLAAAVMGLLPACMTAVGRVGLDGTDLAAGDQIGLRALWHNRSCLLPQEPALALAPLLRAATQLRLSPAGCGKPALGAADALAWLAYFGLDGTAAGRLPCALSGGMAQRLLMALVARSPARVLVADEPTKGLDTERKDAVVAVLAGLRDAGRALLVITHDLTVAKALGGDVAMLEGGRLTETGKMATVLEAPRSRFARACVAADPAGWAARVPSPGGAKVASGEALVLGRGGRMIAGPLGMEAREGTVTAVLGPSGAGKTTLGDTMLGLAAPMAGRIAWLGRPLDRATRRTLRPRFQKLHQDPTAVFPPGRRFADSLADLRRLTDGVATLRRIPDLLERLQVPAAVLGRRPGEVSGGEAQRVALARVLALCPALLVADEPASRLDLPVQAEALRLLRDCADEEGMAILLITHSAMAARAMADGAVHLGSSSAAGLVPCPIRQDRTTRPAVRRVEPLRPAASWPEYG